MSLKHAILTILVESEKTGYDLTKSFETSIGYYWSASHQQIYKTLAQMLADEWVDVEMVAQSDKPDKKVYSLADKGLQELKHWAVSGSKAPANKNQLLIKMLLARVVGTEPILKHLKLRLKEVYAVVAEYSKIEKEYFTPKPDSHAHLKNVTSYLTLRHGIASAHAELDWLHEAIETLEANMVS